MVALLMPATSPCDSSMSSVLKPLRSPQRKNIRSIIEAQSCASVPPEPDWISKKALLASISPENIRLNSKSATLFSKCSKSSTTVSTVSSSSSSTAISSNSSASAKPRSRSLMVLTITSNCPRSLPSD